MILTADLHLRRNPPRARTDDYTTAQERKLRFILKQAQTSQPLLVAGDFFHQSRPGEGMLRWVIDLLREYKVKPICVPGQHDLPGHSLEQIGESGLGVLAAAGVIQLLCNDFLYDDDHRLSLFGQAFGSFDFDIKFLRSDTNTKILLWHHMVINNELWPGQEADKATAILRKYKQFNLIITGDNHQSFMVSPSSDLDGKEKLLINPGSMMRMTATQVDHKPCVFKWEQGKLEQIFLPIEENVLDLTELEQTKERDGRISAFVERLNTQHEIGLDFQKNLEIHLQTNEIKENVKKIIWECVE